MTLWHGSRLARQPLAVIFNRLLHYREYVVLNLPGVRIRSAFGASLFLPCDDSSLARRRGIVYLSFRDLCHIGLGPYVTGSVAACRKAGDGPEKR